MSQVLTVTNYKGYYATLVALTTAIPVGSENWWAIVEDGSDIYIWNVADEEWATGAGAIPAGSVTNAMLANMVQSTIKGRASGAGTGSPQDLTGAQVVAITGAEVTTNKDATGGYAGLTLFKINFKNALNTFTSFFTNSNTAARTYTFQNRDGTIADDTDLALKANLASPTFTGNPAAPTQSANDNSTKLATTAYADGQSSNASVIAKVLTGISTTAAAVLLTASDTILSGFSMVNRIITNLSNGFAKFIGATALRTYTLPDSDATLLYSGGALGTPSSGVATNLTGTASGLTAGNVTTNANLTGDVTSVGNATTLATVNSNVGTFGSATQVSVVTVNGKGLVTAASNTTVTPAIGSITGLGTGIATALAVNVGSAGAPVVNGGALGTPSSGVGTNLTGTASGLTAGTVTTNANLTGPITSVGNATTVANSIALPGSPTTTTQSASDNSTKIATTAYADVGLALKANAASPIFTGAALTQVDVTANTGSAYTIDQANGASFNLTMNAATPTLTLQTAPTSGKTQTLFVRLIQDGTGGRVPSFANVTWASGIAPTVASAIGAVTCLSFVGNGTIWTGFAALQSSDNLTLNNITSSGTLTTTAIKKALRVVTAAGAVTVSATTDHVVVVNKTVGAATVVNIPAGVTGQEFVIKDGKADAATNNITLTPAAGNIDGAGTYVINTNNGSATIIYNGTQWNLI